MMMTPEEEKLLRDFTDCLQENRNWSDLKAEFFEIYIKVVLEENHWWERKSR